MALAPVDYESVRADIRKLVDEVIRPNAESNDQTGEFPRKNLEALAKHGWNSVLVPEALDGLGLNHVAFAIAAEEIASADASTGLIYVMHVSATQAVYLFGTEDQKQRWVRGARQGKIGTFSTSERATGGHFWHNLSRAKRSGTDYVIDLEKSFTTSAGHADFYVLTTQTPDAVKPSDITWFIVDGKARGIKPGAWEALGVRANHSGSLRVDNVLVPERDRLGREARERRSCSTAALRPTSSASPPSGMEWHGVRWVRRRTTRPERFITISINASRTTRCSAKSLAGRRSSSKACAPGKRPLRRVSTNIRRPASPRVSLYFQSPSSRSMRPRSPHRLPVLASKFRVGMATRKGRWSATSATRGQVS